MKGWIRRCAAQALDIPGIANALVRDRKRLGIIFVLHRFEDRATGVGGMPPAALRELLAGLRRKKIRLASLIELLEIARTPEPPPGPWVAFTLDDGYEDQVRVGLPIFQEFDVPATLFPISGFVDGRLWPWWDRVEHLILGTDTPPSEAARLAQLSGLPTPEVRGLSLDDDTGRCGLICHVMESLKAVSTEERERALGILASAYGITLPASAPPRYSAASWNDLRRWEQAGLHCGCHTDSHPILTWEPDAVVQREVERSWMRLRAELEAPLPILAFPNGRWDRDFGAREVAAAQRAGMLWGLSGDPGYLKAPEQQPIASHSINSRFRIPRCFLSGDRPPTLRLLSGLAPIPRRTLGGGG